jgi:enoyl-CoA hydratase/carnithine racemase
MPACSASSTRRPANTKDIFFSARQFGAAEALAMGVVNKVLPEAELAAFVKEYAGTIAENAPLTIAAVKQSAIEALKPESERNLKLVADMVARCFASQDYFEGAPPSWRSASRNSRASRVAQSAPGR